MPAPDHTAERTPPTCEIRDWRVFTNGFHKDSFYSPAMVQRIAANFAAIPPADLTPVAGLGHDRKKRIAASIGLPNVGEVTGCRATPGGDLYLTVTNVPAWLGGMINARRYRAGSVELLPEFRSPSDASTTYPGPVLSGVAVLGDEQPAVKGCEPPRAVFADGSPVPPNHDPMPVSGEVMASLYSDAAPHPALCFSDATPLPTGAPMTPLTPDQEAALLAKGVAADVIASLKGGAAMAAQPAVDAAPVPPPASPASPTPMGGDASQDQFAEMCKKYADDPAATADQKMMAAMYSAMSKKFGDETGELKKRIGAFEASAEAAAKKDEEAKMAAFSADVDARCDRLVRDGKVSPAEVASVVKPSALNIGRAKTFSSEADRVKVLGELFATYEGRAVNPAFARAAGIATAKDAATGKRVITPSQAQMIRPDGPLDRAAPTATRALREATVVGAA